MGLQYVYVFDYQHRNCSTPYWNTEQIFFYFLFFLFFYLYFISGTPSFQSVISANQLKGGEAVLGIKYAYMQLYSIHLFSSKQKRRKNTSFFLFCMKCLTSFKEKLHEKFWRNQKRRGGGKALMVHKMSKRQLLKSVLMVQNYLISAPAPAPLFPLFWLRL